MRSGRPGPEAWRRVCYAGLLTLSALLSSLTQRCLLWVYGLRCALLCAVRCSPLPLRESDSAGCGGGAGGGGGGGRDASRSGQVSLSLSLSLTHTHTHTH
eukprot:3055428-Rhodomonas_salina.4